MPRVSITRHGMRPALNKSQVWAGSKKLPPFRIHGFFYRGLLSGWPRKNGLASRWEADSRNPREGG